MVKVRRANVVLRIAEQQVSYYLSQGYNVINDAGEVIQASIPRDIGTLQKAYVEHLDKIEALEKEIAQLKKKQRTTTAKKKDE